MADRLDYYFRQRVTEAELDLGFELLERADRNLAADIGVFGVVSGAAPAPHSPVPDLIVDLTAPARAYDRLGQRIFFGTGQRVDCAVDSAGVPTEVMTAGKERWLGVFLRFDRSLSDPRTDGNSQQVYFRRDEAFQLVVHQGPEGDAGAALKVPLREDELLVCDVRRRHGQTQIVAADLDTSRRQAFVFATGDAVEIVAGAWAVIAPAVATVQAALDAVDALLAGHFGGTAHRHPAGQIGYTPHGFVAATTVQAAVDELVDDLSSAAAGSPGAARVGADLVVGTPRALPAGSVDSQLALLLGWLNDHLAAVTGAHSASAIAAATHEYISGKNVQAQLQEIVADLKSQAAGLGAAQVGDPAVTGSPRSLPAGTVRDQLAALLGHVNTHLGAADHDGRYYTEAEADARFYNVGEKVADADTLDGSHAAAFATAGHLHDERYLRLVYSDARAYDPSQERALVTLADRPDVIALSYNYLDASGVPEATTYVAGSHTPELRCRVTKIDRGGGDKDFQVFVQNGATTRLWLNVAVYARTP
jgi:hypothetical protein